MSEVYAKESKEEVKQPAKSEVIKGGKISKLQIHRKENMSAQMNLRASLKIEKGMMK